MFIINIIIIHKFHRNASLEKNVHCFIFQITLSKINHPYGQSHVHASCMYMLLSIQIK